MAAAARERKALRARRILVAHGRQREKGVEGRLGQPQEGRLPQPPCQHPLDNPITSHYGPEARGQPALVGLCCATLAGKGLLPCG